MVVKRKRKAATEPTISYNPGMHNGVDSEHIRVFESLKAITKRDIKAVIPQPAQPSQVVNVDYQIPDIPEGTMKTLKKIKSEWVPGDDLFLENAQRVSVHVFNETVQKYSLDRDQAKRAFGDMISEIDRKLRLLRFPASAEKIFDPNTLDEYFATEKELEQRLDLHTRIYNSYLPILDQIDEAQEKHDKLLEEIEELEEAIEKGHHYNEPVVDPDDYAQSLLLFNSNTLNLFTS